MMKRDLTKGNVVGNLVTMAIPMMLGFMAQTLYDLVDMAWVGRLSAGAVAAVTIFATIYWMSFVLNNIVGNSSVSLISQSFGAGDKERTRRVVEQTLVFKSLLAVVASAIMLTLLPRLLGIFTDDPVVLADALSYGRVRLIMLPVMFSSLTVATALRCVGDSRRAMYIMFVSAGLNILLDPIFIFDRVPGLGLPGFGLGVLGAALATEISAACSFLFGAWMLFSGKSQVQPTLKGLLRLDWQIDRQLIMIGLPVSFESLLRSLAEVFILRFVSVYGTIAVATMGIVQRVTRFCFVPLEGLMSGGSTIVGQNLGAGNVPRAERTSRAGAGLGVICMLFFAVIAYLFPTQILGLFSRDAAVLSLGRSVLYVFMPGLVIAGLTLGLATALMGAGYNLPFLVSGIAARWGIQVPFLLLAVPLLRLPFIYAAVSYPLAEAMECIVIVIAFLRGRWKTWRVVGAPAAAAAEAEEDSAVLA
jgi:putative MATE family efflux protein